MKKSTLISLSLCIMIAFSSLAQDNIFIRKGSWMAGSDLNLGIDKDLDLKYFSVSPSAGYFFGRRTAVGLKLNYENIKQTSLQTASASVFTRYYFGRHRVAPFAELAYGLGRSRYKYTNEESYNTSILNGSIGLNYFVSKNIALEGIISYNHYMKNKVGSYNFGVGIQFYFGRNRD